MTAAGTGETLATVGRDVGRILMALGGLLYASLVVPLAWGEFFAVPALLVSGTLPLALGWGLSRRYRDAETPAKRHGMLVAALGWFAVAVFGAVPFLLVAWTVAVDPTLLSIPTRSPAATRTLAAFRHPLNALFESMSGFTGTGLTMTREESTLPHTLQWWRSLTEWIGGVGVIVLTTAVLSRPGSGSLTLYESEARSRKIHPSVVSTVRTIWWIFLLFTLVSIIALWLAGMPAWDSINHAMTGLSTGGFSVTDASIGTYDSATIDFVLVPIMAAGSIAFPVHYLLLRGELENFYRDLQTRWVIGLFAAGTAVLSAILLLRDTYETGFAAFRYALFQFVSAMSCAGFQTAVDATTVALGTWPTTAQLLFAGAMVIGGAAGSTVGGIKVIRAVTLLEGVRHRIGGVFVPGSAVRRLTIGDRRLGEHEADAEFSEAAIVALLWIAFLVLGTVVLLWVLPPDAYTLENVLLEVASAQGNVGLSTGITGPEMHPLAKVTFLFNMWIGRLEIIPVLVLLRSVFVHGGIYR
ncbi:MAG: TrkH family potassium uptake protein [Halanaeroarchaeum sp.]